MRTSETQVRTCFLSLQWEGKTVTRPKGLATFKELHAVHGEGVNNSAA
jgi:hypothetical protein